MSTETLASPTGSSTQHVDVLIVGAGISGIGSAYHLQTQQPGRSYAIVEALDHFGGTWYVHRYPGVRSDSDLFTFGYRFKPWMGAPIASAEEIQKYLGEVIEENGIGDHIHYNHRIENASWDSATSTWTVNGRRTDTGEAVQFTANFLWMCQGYYRHAEGYTPEWPGFENYQGTVVHPQTWPEDLDYRDKDVLVIGSGATTATLVPAIAADVKHVTVLQRSPTYFWVGENRNELADSLRELDIPDEWIHEIVRRRVLHDQNLVTKMSVEQSDFIRDVLIESVKAQLPEGYDVATHFTPRYRPWQQRIAFVPDGDLFKGISSGQASVVTDEIDHFTPEGVVTKSGTIINADIVITATGFNLAILGDINFTVDNEPVDLAKTVTYRGMMFTGVPNLAWIFGYFRASWTLRADLIGDFVCRLLSHMDEKGANTVVPTLRSEDLADEPLEWMDPDNFNPGYLMRSMELLPKRLNKPQWQHTQDYWVEKEEIPTLDLDDGCLSFS